MKKTLIAIALSTSIPFANAVTIDIMVVYDQPAIRYLASNGISSKLYAADLINKINTPFKNSGIDVKYRLAHSTTVNYSNVAGTNGMNMNADLRYITANEQIKQLRQQYQADLVHFVVNIDHPRYGSWMSGIAYEPCMSAGQVDVACSRKYAYSVSSIQDTHYSSIAGSSSHEIGHNLGAGHARNPNMNETATFEPYGYGYYFTSSKGYDYHTVMAYSRNGSRRAPYFSTPCKTYKGQKVGIANIADNRRAIQQTMGIVANYYGSQQHYDIPLSYSCQTTVQTPENTTALSAPPTVSATTVSTDNSKTTENITKISSTSLSSDASSKVETKAIAKTAENSNSSKQGIIFSAGFD